jgi:outer membrane lipopolysaccharide assembly protein LptE/RlpB
MRSRMRQLILWGCVFWLSGCGVYSASTGRVDKGIRRVGVPYLENQSTEPNIEIELTEAIIAALQEDNTLQVVAEDDADSLLRGRVLRYQLKPAFATAARQVDEYQVQILVEMDFVVKASGEKLFEGKRISGNGNFILNDPDGSSEETARTEAAAEIVRSILAAVVEDW